jgi:DNA mismatch repair protein MutL
MNQKIHVLPELLIKRIAAGEVIERPAAVVKELFENSLDANSKEISLFIKDAGLKLIKVVDNGDGMKEEDALICCERHATSKISDITDLEEISTLGFRGEALASIGSVSRLTITTCTETDQEGTQIIIEQGKIQEVLKVAAKRGTTVAVNDLFANIPARRKFLKTPSTELKHILTIFRRIALSHPKVDFSIFVEDEKTMDIRRDSHKKRIRDLFGDQKTEMLIPVNKEISGITINGFISRSGEYVSNRNEQYTFLNNRYIVNKSLIHAIHSAYGPNLIQGKYPIYILFINMNPIHFDVNVHPTKNEVRFTDERFIHNTLNWTLKEILCSPTSVPEFHLIQGKKKNKSYLSNYKPDPADMGQLTLDMQRPMFEKDAGNQIVQKEIPSLWQIHNKYIISQIKSGLTIIDQHVAHERILYEQALRSRQSKGGFSQQLLFPQTVLLPPEDFLILTEILPFLEKIGFGIKAFGKNTMIIEAVPMEIKTGSERELLMEIIHEYEDLKKETVDVWDAVAKAFACKSAIKSGDRLSLQEMASLIDQLFATKEPYQCPHGRPIILNLTLEEIDKRFGR